MKKILVLVCLFVVCICGTSFAAEIGVISEVLSTGTTDLSISGVGTIYTMSRPIDSGVYYSTMYKAVSATSTPDVTITFEESYTKPATEGASDSNWVAPEGSVAINTNLTTETWHLERLLLVPAKYYRYKIVGNAGNATDTIVNIKTPIQEFDS